MLTTRRTLADVVERSPHGIRLEPWGHDLVLIALTGWGQEEDRRRSREAGFDEHMVKPVDVERLKTLLSTLGSAATRPTAR